MSAPVESPRAGDGKLPPLPTPAEFFVFAGLDWHRATSSYFAQMNGQTNTLALYTADQMRAYALAAAPAAAPTPLTDEKRWEIARSWRGYEIDGPLTHYCMAAVERAHGIQSPATGEQL